MISNMRINGHSWSVTATADTPLDPGGVVDVAINASAVTADAVAILFCANFSFILRAASGTISLQFIHLERDEGQAENTYWQTPQDPGHAVGGCFREN